MREFRNEEPSNWRRLLALIKWVALALAVGFGLASMPVKFGFATSAAVVASGTSYVATLASESDNVDWDWKGKFTLALSLDRLVSCQDPVRFIQLGGPSSERAGSVRGNKVPLPSLSKTKNRNLITLGTRRQSFRLQESWSE